MSIGEYEIKDWVEENIMFDDNQEKVTLLAFDRLIVGNDFIKEDIKKIWTLESNHDYDDDDLIDGTSTLEELIENLVRNEVLEDYDGDYHKDFTDEFFKVLSTILDGIYDSHKCDYTIGSLISLFLQGIQEDIDTLVYELCDESYLIDYLKSIIENNSLDFKED